MNINPKSVGPDRPKSIQSNQASAVDRKAVGPVAPAELASDQADKARISDVVRPLVPRHGDRAETELDAARAAGIRDRVLNGAYHSIEVVDAVARRVLASGDI